MSQKTVMEKADEILANMGISDTVPLQEASSESVNAVGKDYSNQELPDVSDAQRDQLLAHSGFLVEAKEEDEDADPVGDDYEETSEENPEEDEKPKRRDTRLDAKKTFSLTKRKRGRRERRGAKTAKNAKETTVVGENTVGMIGVGPLGNSPAPDPDKPYGKNKKNKKRRSTLKFIDLAFNK